MSDVDLRPRDTTAIEKGCAGLVPVDPPLGRDDPLDLKGAQLRKQAELDGLSTTSQALRPVVVQWCALLGTLYAIALWIIYAAI